MNLNVRDPEIDVNFDVRQDAEVAYQYIALWPSLLQLVWEVMR